MAYFDYGIPENPGSGLGALLGMGVKVYDRYKDRKRQEELDAIAKQKALTDERRQAASQKFMEDQARAVNARQEQTANREKTTFDQQQADRMTKTVTDIGKAFGAGGLGQAQALGAASQFPDAQGRMQGVGVRQLDNPFQNPGEAPQAPKVPEMVGPLETPEMAQTRQGPQAALDVMAEEEKRRQFGQDEATLPTRRAEHAKATEAFQEGERNPGFELSFPNGQKVVQNAAEQKRAKEADNQEMARNLLKSLPPGADPDYVRMLTRKAGLIGIGLGAGDQAALTNTTAATQAQEGRVALADINNKADLEQARIRAKKVGAGLGGGSQSKISELVKMKEDGATDSEISARAAALGVAPKAYLPSVDRVRVTHAENEKASAAEAGGNVIGDNGEVIGNLGKDPAAHKRAKEVNDYTEAAARFRGSLERLKDHFEKHGSVATAAGFDLSAAARERRSLADAAAVAGGKFYELGALANADIGIVRGVTGGAGVESMLGLGVDKTNKTLESIGQSVAGVRKRAGIDPAGKPKPAPKAAASKGGKSASPLDALDSWLSEKGY